MHELNNYVRHTVLATVSRATNSVQALFPRYRIKCGMTGSGGFTLIELSIVLVIIGLLAGGVLVGRDLIKSAEIRSQISQIEKYNTAVNTFKAKYNCLPGDCKNVSEYFGTSWYTTSRFWNDNAYYIGDTYGNGDGNGAISESFNSSANPSLYWGEPALVFAHLSMAGMTECCDPKHTSTWWWWDYGTTAADVVYPATKAGGGGFVAITADNVNGWWLGVAANVPASTCGGGDIMDYLVLSPVTPCSHTTGVLNPAQAQAIDAKIDDGRPTTGKIYYVWVWGGDNYVHKVPYRSGQYCITYPSSDTNSYNISNPDAVCNIFIAW